MAIKIPMFNDSAKEEVKGKLLRELVSEEFLEMARDNTRPWRQLMSYYRCAMRRWKPNSGCSMNSFPCSTTAIPLRPSRPGSSPWTVLLAR